MAFALSEVGAAGGLLLRSNMILNRTILATVLRMDYGGQQRGYCSIAGDSEVMAQRAVGKE